MDWLSAVEQLRREGSPGVLVDGHEGPRPRPAGRRRQDGRRRRPQLGQRRRRQPRGGRRAPGPRADRRRRDRTRRPSEFRLNEHERNRHGRQCCGGEVTLVLEPLPARPSVAIFGMGHVGLRAGQDPVPARGPAAPGRLPRAISSTSSGWPTITDGAADVTVHHAAARRAGAGAAAARRACADHEPRPRRGLRAVRRRAAPAAAGQHRADRLVARSGRASAAGSRRCGHSAGAIARITCPIGLPEIGGKEPAVIAVSVAACAGAGDPASTAPSASSSAPHRARANPAAPVDRDAEWMRRDPVPRHHSRHPGRPVHRRSGRRAARRPATAGCSSADGVIVARGAVRRASRRSPGRAAWSS